ncbi:MAG: hypothetical protein JSW61_04445 [Candidatus Thorarchaeota archaeon]|nr:MAG: hypothetical protein JSW61_04445 [Candidatus Thorarchaeota archaeon]
MDEEKYRVEETSESEEERTGILKPLPTAEGPDNIEMIKGRAVPIVKFLGIRMRESRKDILVMILIPLLIAIVDVNLYALVVVDVLEESSLYMFAVPLLAAIPIGLVVPQTSRALFSAFMTAVFFMTFFLLFMASPALIAPELDASSFIISGLVVASIYLLFIIVASLVGTFIGAVAREFA